MTFNYLSRKMKLLNIQKSFDTKQREKLDHINTQTLKHARQCASGKQSDMKACHKGKLWAYLLKHVIRCPSEINVPKEDIGLVAGWISSLTILA